jgi:RNA polymerase sigma factor FliA
MNATLMEPPAVEILSIPVPQVLKPRKLSHFYERVEHGSAAEADRVEKNLVLVKHIVSRLAMTLPAHVDFQDIYSAGLVGLLQAVRNFKPDAGSSFESYARVRIKGAIFDELRRMDWVPRSVHEKFKW